MTTEISERLYDLRKAHNYSQQQLAMKLGLTQGAISQWEKGLTIPAADQIISLAKVYGMSTDEILGIEKKPVATTDPWDPDQMDYADREDQTTRMLARGVKRLPPDSKQQLLDMARVMFKEYFDDEGNRR